MRAFNHRFDYIARRINDQEGDKIISNFDLMIEVHCKQDETF